MAYRRIAVGVDLGAERRRPTPGSERAVALARTLAAHWNAHLTLVHSSVADEHWDPARGWTFADGSVSDSGVALDAVVAGLDAAGPEVEALIAHERADVALARLAMRGEVDLVVVGKRSVPGLDGRRLGSIALKLLHTCPCAVWVVEPDAEAPRRLLAATDLSAVGERVLEAAGAVAVALGAELHVVHAVQIPLSAQFEDAETAWTVEACRDAEARIARILERAGAAGKGEVHVALGSPTQAILGGAERFAPDLVVLGSIGRDGFAGLLLGNTAERVLPRLDGSLLVVKPEEFHCPLEDAS